MYVLYVQSKLSEDLKNGIKGGIGCLDSKL